MCEIEPAAKAAIHDVSKRATKWVVLRIAEGEEPKCVLEASGASTNNEEADFEAFRAAVPKDQCRYAVYDLGFQKNGTNFNKLVFVGYAPDACTKMVEKFTYANYSDTVKSVTGGINLQTQTNDHDDLTYAKLVARF